MDTIHYAEHGYAAYLVENPDRVIFESGNIYEFVEGRLGGSNNMRQIESREPFVFRELPVEQKLTRYGFLGVGALLFSESPDLFVWEY